MEPILIGIVCNQTTFDALKTDPRVEGFTAIAGYLGAPIHIDEKMDDGQCECYKSNNKEAWELRLGKLAGL